VDEEEEMGEVEEVEGVEGVERMEEVEDEVLEMIVSKGSILLLSTDFSDATGDF